MFYGFGDSYIVVAKRVKPYLYINILRGDKFFIRT